MMAQKTATPVAANKKNVAFANVLERELEAIDTRRATIFSGTFTGKQDGFDDPHKARTLGVAFSGGGIRSATFNLGILQGLAEHGLLKYVDYLSTVSGGGYIGSWLHGVIRTTFGGNPETASNELLSPTLHTFSGAAPAAKAPKIAGHPRVPGPPEEDPISFLRKFSNYLAPRSGVFSVDVWVIALIWLRNVLLNQLILIPALGVPILLALLLVFLEQIPEVVVWAPLQVFLKGLALVLALIALGLVIRVAVKNLGPIVAQSTGERTKRTAINSETHEEKKWQRRSAWIVPSFFVAAFVLGCVNLTGMEWSWRIVMMAVFALLFGLLQHNGFVRCYEDQHPDNKGRAIPHLLWMSAVCGAVTASLVYAVWMTVAGWDPWDKVAFTTPLITLSLIAGVALQIGLMGADFPDAAREWIARIGSMLALTCAGWTALFLLAVRAPQGFAWLIGWHGNTAIGSIATWVVTTAAGVIAGHSEHSDGRTESMGGKAMNVLVKVAPIVFIVGYLLLLSYGAHAALSALGSAPASATTAQERPSRRLTVDVRVPETAPAIEVDVRGPEEKGWLETKLEPLVGFAKYYTQAFEFLDKKGKADLDDSENGRRPKPESLGAQISEIVTISQWQRPMWVLVLLLGSSLVVWVAAGRININEFSLHHFYKNRLVRCYLGASNTKRKPNYLTGFDPNDDFPIADLVPSEKYLGPYPIVNAALNLNAGAELAQQERKSASFVFTPQFCGFAPSRTKADEYECEEQPDELDREGYRPTKGYSRPAGPGLGTTLAISGAAANPNMGYSTSGPMAFLLTVFDARLGWWLGNPRSKIAAPTPGPSFALWYLLAELLGQTVATSRFVNLSDGGHFDNLGLYELVRRRCRFIVIGDGEQDKDLTFGSLGGAIRKCRADFGVEIDIDPTPIRLSSGFSKAHCVVGTITYPEIETGAQTPIVGEGATPVGSCARGWILYLKSSLTGDEPEDVIEYRSRFADFPHQSTADQFFGESQFESYRRLGLHVVRDAFECVDLELLDQRHPRVLVNVFQALTRQWYAPPPVQVADMSRLNDDFSKLIQRLGEDDDLKPLIPALVSSEANPKQPKLTEESRMFLVEAIQLMENVYTEFKLEHAINRANPRNAGWMRVFRRWAQQAAVKEVWKDVKPYYNTLFCDFMDEILKEPENDLPQRR
jgi:Patatin-like phospholipase